MAELSGYQRKTHNFLVSYEFIWSVRPSSKVFYSEHVRLPPRRDSELAPSKRVGELNRF
jgi:hypothetical protein